MYPAQPKQVRVPILLEAAGFTVGNNLVATIGQPGIYAYHLLRCAIIGPIGTFNLYRGSTSMPPFSSVYSPGVTQAQFNPGELIAPGNNLIGVWVGGAGSSGLMTITTDGGL